MTKSALLWTIAGLTIFACSWAARAIGQEPTEAQSTLAHLHRKSLSTYTLEVEVNLPVNLMMSGQGRATHVMRITVGNDATAIVWKASDLPPPTYYPPDTGKSHAMDYDAKGNLKLAMWSQGAALRSQAIHVEYSESIGLLVAPDGAVLRRTDGGMLNRRNPADSNTVNLNLLRRILWALGRPPTDGIGDLRSGDVKANGTHQLRTDGWWSPGYGAGAICELWIDPGNGYLVRQASFGAEGEAPRAECRSEGVRRFGHVVLAERGEFTLHPIETVKVRLLSFSPDLDPDLIVEARKVIARSRTRTVQVMDYREDPAAPKARVVPAGKLGNDD